jgi:hypothetical protein
MGRRRSDCLGANGDVRVALRAASSVHPYDFTRNIILCDTRQICTSYILYLRGVGLGPCLAAPRRGSSEHARRWLTGNDIERNRPHAGVIPRPGWTS